MRHVIGIYDAPAPAGAGLADLHAAGFDAGDIWVAPRSAAAHLGPDSPYMELSGDQAALTAHLGRLGVPQAAAAGYAAAVSHGALLVVVRTPALSVPLAAEALQVPGATDLEQHQARMQADPDLSYDWDAH